MKVDILSKDKEKFTFMLSGVKPAFANGLRRAMVDEVPAMAIEDVEIKKNSSALYDEILAHRLGLVVLETDLKSYELPSKCKCKGEGCARCQLQLTLKVKGPGVVYAEDMKSKDPKVVPAQPKAIITKLLKGQEVELIATAVLGKGKVHTKWSPCSATYKNEPVIEISGKIDNAEEVAEKCPLKLFEAKGGNLKLVKDYQHKCHLCEACQEASKGKVKVTFKEDSFIYTVEPWGQLKPVEIVKAAADVLSEKCDEFIELVKAAK
ncbi:MAG: DNA-directed RNA polymerase subunit D [Candidatus Woesearchaeota archaeon]|jgi:DNA-directed RNA polymerase subunit D